MLHMHMDWEGLMQHAQTPFLARLLRVARGWGAHLHQDFDAHGQGPEGLDEVEGVLVGASQEAQAQQSPGTVAPARHMSMELGSAHTQSLRACLEHQISGK